MIVVVVLVTMMSIMFRLANIGGDAEKRNITVDRLNRLENALSGYYAAFGTYPPVKLHGSRNPFLTVSEHGIQNSDGDENSSIWGWINADGTGVSNGKLESEAWSQVEAACKSQPVACMFPFPTKYKDVAYMWSALLKHYAETGAYDKDERKKRIFSAGFDDGVSENPGRFSPYRNEAEWGRLQLFKFGLMSYLLPRYLTMLNFNVDDGIAFDKFMQWTGNNVLPSDPFSADGAEFDNGWKGMAKNYVQSDRSSDVARVMNIPSQAACARWMGSFEKSLYCFHDFVFFGVNVKEEDADERMRVEFENGNLEVYSPGGYENDSTANQYLLDLVTMKDGWYNEFYYYSAAPYQSYVVWSGGPNGKTFPPWISRDKLSAQANKCIGYWTKDDIVNMSN